MIRTILDELRAEIKRDVSRWEEVIVELGQGIARCLAAMVLEDMDVELMRGRGAGLRAVGKRGRWVSGLFGDLRVERRLYRDGEGRSRYLLDEMLGLRERCHVSPALERVAAALSTRASFQVCEEILGMLVPGGLSHTTIHRLVGRVTDPYIDREEKEVEALFEDGVLPESEGKVVSHLMVEADGTYVALQREDKKRGEIKVGIAYEGWQAIGKDRYQLKGKMVYTGMMGGVDFWERFSLFLHKGHRIGRVDHVIVGGDGAEWVKEGARVLGGRYQLDRFHLCRAIRTALGNRHVGEIYEACISGNLARAEELLREAQSKAEGEAAKDVALLRGYILSNATGLKDYRLDLGARGMRGLGAIESNVGKIICVRMKGGMSWTRKGADRMARLLGLRASGELRWPRSYDEAEHKPRRSRFRLKPEQKGPTEDKYRRWLEAAVPALVGPHVNHPWAQALAGIVSCHQTI